MSQQDFVTIDPTVTSGSSLADKLNKFRSAVYSQHSGAARPSYVIAGQLWLDTATATPVWKLFDGADDIIIGTFNYANNTFALAGSTGYVSKTGDQTMAGALSAAAFNIVGAANTNRNLIWTTAGNPRFSMYIDASPESGGGVGSNLAIARFNDSGAYIDNPIIINRSTGIVSMSSELNVARTVYFAQSGGGIELGRTTGGPADPSFIDFHTSQTVRDYNVRLIATGESAVGLGTLNVEAGNFTWNGSPVWTTGNLVTPPAGEAEAGVGSAARVWSAYDVKRAINALAPTPVQGIGVGQTWQAPSRGALVMYQNTTGRPIQFYVRFQENSGTPRYFRMGPDTGVGAIIGPAINGSIVEASVVIPNGYYYYLDNSQVLTWLELR